MKSEILGDFYEVLSECPDGYFDMIIADLPYGGGTTSCKWDTDLDLDVMWKLFSRITKDKSAMVFTATQPFTSKLVSSNYKMFKHEWIWSKNRGTGFQISKFRPLMSHESILVFCKSSPNYFPVMREREKPRKSNFNGQTRLCKVSEGKRFVSDKTLDKRFPISVIEFPNNNQKEKIHPTQKPVELFKYLIETYSKEGDMILDPVAGSFTTAIACKQLNRNYVCIEKDPEFFEKGTLRLK